MAYVNTATSPGLLSRIYSAWADNKVEQFRRSLYTRTIRELERLSDRQLRDIGIARSEIRQKAYDSVYRNAPYAGSDGPLI